MQNGAAQMTKLETGPEMYRGLRSVGNVEMSRRRLLPLLLMYLFELGRHLLVDLPSRAQN